MSVYIPHKYWEGKENLEKGCPWFTPGAVIYLDSHIQPHFKVLEIGSGGSTIFFAERSSEVISIEDSQEWYKKIKTNLEDRKISNVQLFFLLINKCEKYVSALPSNYFDAISIDFNYASPKERSRIAKLSIAKLKEGGFLILDNYSGVQKRGIDSWAKVRFGGWLSYFFDDPHWYSSKGTSINIKPFRYHCTIRFKTLSILRIILTYLKRLLKIYLPQIENTKLYQKVFSIFNPYNLELSLFPPDNKCGKNIKEKGLGFCELIDR